MKPGIGSILCAVGLHDWKPRVFTGLELSNGRVLWDGRACSRCELPHKSDRDFATRFPLRSRSETRDLSLEIMNEEKAHAKTPVHVLPDDVPCPPEGLDYFGTSSPRFSGDCLDSDFAAFHDGEWKLGFHFAHGLVPRAIRRGTELHRLNFPVDEASSARKQDQTLIGEKR